LLSKVIPVPSLDKQGQVWPIQVGPLLACDIESTSGWAMFNPFGQGLGKTIFSGLECRSSLVGLDLSLGGPMWDQVGLG